MSLYAHQQKIINEDPKKVGLFLGTGSGKTKIATLLAKGETLVVCPKTQKLDGTWQHLKNVISKEDFKKQEPGQFDTVIIDEAHYFAGVTPNIRYRNKKPIPKTSQLFAKMATYLQEKPPKRLYLLTATPTRSPMAVWGFAYLLGKQINWNAFRSFFYFRLNIPGRDIFVPHATKEKKDKLGEIVRSLGYTGRLEDYFDVPPQIHKIIHCPLSKEQELELQEVKLHYPDPIVQIGKRHQIEQGKSKLEAIDDLVEEYPKVVIFAKYLAQIQIIALHLKKKKIPTFVLTGSVKDRGTLLKNAENSPRCVFIAQMSITTGYELPSFRCVIYSSLTYSFVDLVQSQGRVLRANALNKNLYVYLLSGEVDKAVWRCLENKKDFSEKIYAEERS